MSQTTDDDIEPFGGYEVPLVGAPNPIDAPNPVGYDPTGAVTTSQEERVGTGGSRDVQAADGPRFVFAFDRDHTVAIGDLSAQDDRELVPLEWVQHLAHRTPHYVYATGNQSLTSEATIPGNSSIVDQHPQGEALAAQDSPRLSAFGPSRETRVKMLEDIHDADRYIVVDDVDLSTLEGWDYFTAWEFVPAVREGDILEGVSFPETGRQETNSDV